MNAEISEILRATILGLDMQIPEIPALHKFVSETCHAHSNAHNPTKPVAPTIFMLGTKFKLKCIGLVNTYRLIKKSFAKILSYFMGDKWKNPFSKFTISIFSVSKVSQVLKT